MKLLSQLTFALQTETNVTSHPGSSATQCMQMMASAEIESGEKRLDTLLFSLLCRLLFLRESY